MGKSGTTEKHGRHLLRILRPLIWWLILVLVLYGIRTHQRLMEKTRLNFSVSMQGQAIDAAATFDGKPAFSGQNIPLGNHTFAVTHPKGEPYSTNMFIWYGNHDLGEIKLKRSAGMLRVQATPPAPTINITGPEFSTTLFDTASTNLTVPTDQYTVRAEYTHWSQMQNSTVLANLTASCVFAPRLGALHITCNEANATGQFIQADGQIIESFTFPYIVSEVPEGTYKVTAQHRNDTLSRTVNIEAGTTNGLSIEFFYGSAFLETKPPGAAVQTVDGRHWGVTPLTLTELPVGNQTFTLQRNGYESVQITLAIVANETNVLQTNLISQSYAGFMNEARRYVENINYGPALISVNQALQEQPDDPAATALKQKITILSDINTAEAWGAQSNYTAGIKFLTSALELDPDNERAKQLLIDYRKREPEQIERQRQERLNLPRESFATLCTKYRDGKLFDEHEFKTKKPADDVAGGIQQALMSVQPPFEINVNNSPAPGLRMFTATQKFSTGLLSSGVRMCLIVVGQTKDDETQILFKVLEYERHHKLELTGPQNQLTIDAELIPLSPPYISQLSEQQRNQLKQGVQIVTDRIQQVIGQ